MIRNATLYIADASLIGSRLFDKFPEIEEAKSLSSDDLATGVILELSFSKITMNFMFSSELSSHLEGLKNYVSNTYMGDENDLIYILGRIQCVSLAIGMVIDHIEESNDKIIDFLFRFSDRLNGILFVDNTLFDYDSTQLTE